MSALARETTKVLWGKRLGAGILLLLMLAAAGCNFLWGGLAPSTPTDFRVTDGEFLDRVRLTWSPVPEAGGYEVWRGPSATGTFTYLASTAYPSYDDTSVVPGTTYWYKVRACNRAGCSEFTPAKAGKALAVGLPAKPTGLTASQGTFADRIKLTWPAVPGATEYHLFKAQTESAVFSWIATLSETTYDDLDVIPGQVYVYKLQACNALGCSTPSDPVSGYAAGAGLRAPQGVTASDGEHAGKVVVTWQAVTGASHYLVYRALAQEATPELLGSTETTTYEDENVEQGTTYWYWVRACDTTGCSPLSQPDSGSPGEEEGPPPPPSS